MDYAKKLILKHDYKEARNWMKTVLELCPQVKDGFEMLIISETLYYGNMHFPNFGVDWYSVLHLHPSATDAEVNTHCQMLLTCTHLMQLERLPGGSNAILVLEEGKSVLCNEPNGRLEFDCKRRDSGLVLDTPRKGSCSSFKQDYLDWKPPVFSSYNVGLDKKGMSKAISSSPPESVAEVVDEIPRHKVFDELPQRLNYLVSPKFCSGQVNSQKTPIPYAMPCTLDPCVDHVLGEIPNHQVLDKMPQSLQHVKLQPIAADDYVQSQKKRPIISKLARGTPECVSDVKRVLSKEVKKPKHQLQDEHLISPVIVTDDHQVHFQERPVIKELTSYSPDFPSDVKTPQVKKPKQLVFDEMPQNPHYAPLDKFKGKVRQEIINGLDIAFISLCENIQMLEYPLMFWEGLDHFTHQLTQFEEMGYDVKKVRERLDTLQRIAERDRLLLDQVDRVRVESQVDEARIMNLRSQLLEVETEMEKCKVRIEKNVNKIDLLKKASMEAVEEFVSAVKSTWK